MKFTILIFLALLLVSCVHKPSSEFVQGGIRIVPPVEKAPGRVPGVLEDGGTIVVTMKDVTGKIFDIYIDHHLGTKTPGAIYLFAHPSQRGSVRVKNEAEFRQKVKFE